MANTPRKKQEIDQEYTNVCAQLGDVHFKIKNLTQIVEAVSVKLKELDNEASLSKAFYDELDAQKSSTPLESELPHHS